jgi:hypothetical protein
VVEQDFSLMSASGVNAVRTYTAPPHWLLEIAHKCNLRILVGLQGERHHTFLHEKKFIHEIRKQVRNGARACAGHPAVLGYLVANEIPASIVRWHGASAVEKFLKQLRDEVKEEDPEALVSYANYPSTEYLDLSFLDLVCFNVFLESQDKYEAYLARLQNLAGNRPLLVTETGLDNNGDTVFNDRPPGITRNTGHGPGYANVDLRFGKTFRLKGRDHNPKQFELAADAFNVLNHVNYKNFVGIITSPFFGRPDNSADPARRLQVSMRFSF